MTTHKNDKHLEEFLLIVTPLIRDRLLPLHNIKHHNSTTRLLHSIHVAFKTYSVTKRLHLNYLEATRGALLHDNFTEKENSYKLLINHPQIALQQTSLNINLTPLEKDIIKKHMFPLTCVPPFYIESWIVNLYDKYCATVEFLPFTTSTTLKRLGESPQFSKLLQETQTIKAISPHN